MYVLFAAATGIRRERISRDRFTGPLIVRVAAELVATALFFGAIVQLDFANAQTILLIVPFAVTLAAALLLGESVSARRYATVLAGFFGVLLVMQPATGGFSFWSLAVVASAACLCLIVGYVFTIQTVRVGDLSVSAPFRYTTLLGAVILGYAFFDEIPDALTIVGCTVILVSGLYSIHLERRATQPAAVTDRSAGSC